MAIKAITLYILCENVPSINAANTRVSVDDVEFVGFVIVLVNLVIV